MREISDVVDEEYGGGDHVLSRSAVVGVMRPVFALQSESLRPRVVREYRHAGWLAVADTPPSPPADQ